MTVETGKYTPMTHPPLTLDLIMTLTEMVGAQNCWARVKSIYRHRLGGVVVGVLKGRLSNYDGDGCENVT